MKQITILTILLVLLLTSCHDYTPKPKGYNRIERAESEAREYVFSAFSFKYPSDIRMDTLKSVDKDEIWFNIVYPEYNATVHCTYLPVTKASLPKALDDSYQMAYSHTLMASGIDQKLFTYAERNVSGILYEIGGNVATPVQFFVTDSVRHFLRGSFYYSTKINADSLAPVTEFITKDIQDMMSSLRWRDRLNRD